MRLGIIILSAFIVFGAAFLVQGKGHQAEVQQQISGRMVDGIRVIDVRIDRQSLNYTVYRGEAIRFILPPQMGTPVLSIPSLAISVKIQKRGNNQPHIELKKTGEFPFILGNIVGTFEVIAERQSGNQGITKKETTNLPLWILDELSEGLDRQMAQRLLTRIHKRARHRTMICITPIIYQI